jgi:C4-dicarboxylate-specific signal transduction histidine kinase
MDGIVGLFEREMQARVKWLVWTGWGVTATILIALATVGWLIVRPATRLIQQQILDLRAAHDVLEDRVRERTRELEESARQVERGAAERSAAEQRHRAVLEMLSHASRTNTLGEMASGLAHELNQPLGAIANYAEGCLVVLDAQEPKLDEVRGVLGSILATTMRAGQVLKRIRGFVTRRGTELTPFDPNHVLQETAELLADEAQRRGIPLKVDLAPGLPYVQGDPVQIQQVLINLARNAFEALSASKPVDQTVVMQTRRSSFGGAAFLVIDHGEGIPQDRLGQIFDAYFSTRAEGMGMGLAISRTIVEAHGSRLTVESEPGVATTFRFTLPASGAVHDSGANCLRG